MDKIKHVVARWCIKLLTIDSIRTWFVVNVLREIDLDDVISALRKCKPEVVACPKCGHKFEKK